MAKHITIRAYGKVQGVFYRHAAKEKATLLGLNGFIQNMDDGSIYVEVEGDDKAIEEFSNWAKTGPQLAKVDQINIQEAPLQNYTDFLIK